MTRINVTVDAIQYSDEVEPRLLDESRPDVRESPNGALPAKANEPSRKPKASAVRSFALTSKLQLGRGAQLNQKTVA